MMNNKKMWRGGCFGAQALRLTAVGAISAFGLVTLSADPVTAASPTSSCRASAAVVTCTFSYDGSNGANGSPQKFVVPAGVTQVTVEAWGAQGGGANGANVVTGESASGGLGGYVVATMAVVKGQVLNVRVGGQPTSSVGGYNGGGTGGPGTVQYSAGAGGGATDIRTGGDSPARRVLVAGGGGGGAFDSYLGFFGGGGDNGSTEQGGAGGGSSGGASFCEPTLWQACGGGASGSSGGAAGTTSSPCVSGGTLGSGGSGCGGGGGGGYYGGGGGGGYKGDCCGIGVIELDGPGGGGSGYVSPKATSVMNQAGLQFGNGMVRISYATAHKHPGLTWSTPTKIDSSGGLISGVSCPTTTFCLAVDTAGNAMIDNSGTWSSPAPVAGPNNSFSGVSCGGPTFCVAVGTRPFDANGDQDLAVIYSNGVWSSNTSVSVHPDETLTGVSCAPGTQSCTAVGWFSGGAPGNTMAGETYDGHAWTPFTGGSGYGSTGDTFTAVSCASAKFCLLGGIVQDRGDIGDFLSVGGQVTNQATMGISGQIDAVACGSSTCVAAGNGGYIFTVKKTKWSGPVNVDGMSTITGLSCVGASSCLAVDNSGTALTARSGSWSAPVSVDPGESLSAVSCATTSFCVAADSAGQVVVGS